MALSAFLKRAGFECDVIDLAFQKDYLEAVREIRPDIIAYSITTGKHGFYQRINLELKKKFRFFAVFGGPHATFFPEFIEEEGVDAVCRGEGEYAFLELVQALGSGKDHRGIQNLWVKQDVNIYRNPVRGLIEDLDTLPFPDRKLLNKYNHYRLLHRRMVLSGRGCPYNCSYCFNHSFNKLYAGKGKIVRKRSVPNLLAELKEIKENYNLERFQFIDDTFILDTQWCREFCAGYSEQIKLPFIAYTRVNLITDEIVKNLAAAGCVTVLYAIESGNEQIRNKILCRNISQEQILDAVAVYKKYGLKTYSQNMVGIPDETLEMAFETLRLNARCEPDYSWCSIFQPYPRTDLWEYCRKKGFLTGEEFDESYYKKSILKIKDKREIENLHHLFSLNVAFPFLLPLTRWLIKLPFNGFYFFLWQLHRAWCYFFRVNWIDLGEIFIKE